MTNSYSTKQGNIMHNQDGNWQENPDGTWSEAIPLPFYGPLNMKQCVCGRHFWYEDNYRRHYREVHTDGKKYERTTTGLVEL